MGSKLVQKFFKNRLTRILGVVFCLIVAIGVVKSVFTLTAKRSIVQEQKDVLRELEAKNADLMVRLKEATTSAFVERQARNKLGLVKEGETVVILDAEKVGKLRLGKEGDDALPLWKQWWGLFF